MSDADSWCEGLVGFERPRYFEGKVLAADDLRQEQTYHRHKHAAHTRAVHGDGTVCGLAVRPTNPPWTGLRRVLRTQLNAMRNGNRMID